MNPSKEQLEQLNVLTPRPQQGAHLIGRGCVGEAANEVTWCCFCLEKSVHIPVFLIDKSEMKCFHTQWLRANQKIAVVHCKRKAQYFLGTMKYSTNWTSLDWSNTSYAGNKAQLSATHSLLRACFNFAFYPTIPFSVFN